MADKPNLCGCGCGVPVAREFKQGHDAKHKSNLFKLASGDDKKVGERAHEEIVRRNWRTLYVKFLAVQQRKVEAAASKPSNGAKKVRKNVIPDGVSQDDYLAAVDWCKRHGIVSGSLSKYEIEDILSGKFDDADEVADGIDADAAMAEQ